LPCRPESSQRFVAGASRDPAGTVPRMRSMSHHRPHPITVARWHPFAAIAALALVLALAWPPPAAARPATYALDPVHTRVQFAVWHAGFSQALGTISGSTGTLQFDPDDWTCARLEVSVPLQRLELGDDAWRRATLAGRLLDAQRWPQAHFVSTRVEPLDARNFIVHGQLTLRGVTRELPLQVRFNALKRHPLPPFRRTAGFSATATLSRSDFGIDAWSSAIGDTVELRIEAEAVRSARAGQQHGADTDTDADGAGEREHPDGVAPAPAAPDTTAATTSAPCPAA